MSGQPLSVEAQPRFVLKINLRHLSLLSIVVGLFVSGYLSYVKLTAVPMTCVSGGMFDCNVVQNSSYSEFFGVPVAYLGFATYLVIGALILLENRFAFLVENGALLVFGITVFAFIFSMWLVYAQFFLLEALCPWCLAHEVNITLLLALVSARVWLAMRAQQDDF